MAISPLPWSCEQEKNGTARYWLRSGEQYIGSIGNGTNGEESQKRAKDNCDMVVKAVNAHDEMVKLIEDIQDHTQYMMENYGYDRGWYDADSDLEKRVDAVLKKVKL